MVVTFPKDPDPGAALRKESDIFNDIVLYSPSADAIYLVDWTEIYLEYVPEDCKYIGTI